MIKSFYCQLQVKIKLRIQKCIHKVFSLKEMLSNEALRKVNIAHQLYKALRDVANDI